MAVRIDKRKVQARALEAMKRGLARAAMDLRRDAKQRVSTGGGKVRHAPSGAPPYAQTGTLRASIAAAPVGGGTTWVIGPTERYGKIQEWGTVGKGGRLPDIRPRNGRCLAVAVHRDAYGKTPRMFGNDLVMVKRPGKPPLLIRRQRTVFHRDGSKSVQRLRREDIMFVLLPKVAVAPHPFMRPALDAIRPRLKSYLEGVIRA